MSSILFVKMVYRLLFVETNSLTDCKYWGFIVIRNSPR